MIKTRPVNGDQIDDQAKHFLGVSSAKDVTIVEGQKADVDKLNEAHEAALLQEACYFGDALVNYVIKHPELTKEQRCWGFVLGLLCVRTDYPDGTVTFDDLADKGGEDLVLEQKSKDNMDVIDFEPDSQKAFPKEDFKKAAEFAELFAKYVSRTKRSLGTGNAQAAYGLGRALHTLRLSFPEDKGGPLGFDHWAASAGLYYREQRL